MAAPKCKEILKLLSLFWAALYPANIRDSNSKKKKIEIRQTAISTTHMNSPSLWVLRAISLPYPEYFSLPIYFWLYTVFTHSRFSEKLLNLFKNPVLSGPILLNFTLHHYTVSSTEMHQQTLYSEYVVQKQLPLGQSFRGHCLLLITPETFIAALVSQETLGSFFGSWCPHGSSQSIFLFISINQTHSNSPGLINLFSLTT